LDKLTALSPAPIAQNADVEAERANGGDVKELVKELSRLCIGPSIDDPKPIYTHGKTGPTSWQGLFQHHAC
jgi:hypothetical protein